MRWMALALLMVGGLARAQLAKPPSYEEAKHHFEEGTKAYNLGEFMRAVEEYKAAYNAKPDPVFLYNIAQAYRLSGNLSQAEFFYRSFLRNMPQAPNRRIVEDRIAALDAEIEKQKAVSTAPPNATVAPGTVPPASSEEAREPSAARPVESRPAGAAAPTTATPAEPHGSTTAAPESRPELTAGPPAKTPVYKKWWLWTVVGVVVVGAAVGAAVGATASSGPAPPASHFGTTTVSF
jgi:hypothetical protein